MHQDSTWHLRNPVTASHAANQRSAAINTGMVATLPLSAPAAILLLPAIGISSAVDGPKTKERRVPLGRLTRMRTSPTQWIGSWRVGRANAYFQCCNRSSATR